MSDADVQLAKLSNQLKSLEIEKRKKQKHIDNIHKTLETAEAELRVVVSNIETLKKRTKNPLVTEHAMLRYIQRVEGRDLNELINTILPPAMANTVKVLGSGTYPVNNFKIKVENGTVVTVVKDGDIDDTDI